MKPYKTASPRDSSMRASKLIGHSAKELRVSFERFMAHFYRCHDASCLVSAILMVPPNSPAASVPRLDLCHRALAE